MMRQHLTQFKVFSPRLYLLCVVIADTLNNNKLFCIYAICVLTML